MLETSEYEPFGQQVNAVGVAKNGPGYTGHVQDGATGLTYMQQRYYDPMIGRFLSTDPVTAYSNPVGAFNRYWYGNNNQYKFTDPDGRAAYIIYEGGKITVELRTKFEGPAASVDNIAVVKKDFESQSGKYTVNGTETQVDFRVTEVTRGTPARLRNTVTMTDGPTDNPTGNGVSYADSYGGTKVGLDVSSRGFNVGEGGHELDHLAGGRDAYIRDQSGKKIPDPTRRGDIMNELPGKMTDPVIREILDEPKNRVIGK